MPVLVDKRISGRGNVALVRRCVAMSLAAENISDQCEVSVVLGDESLIRQLNREYMGIDAPTDVLSFPQEESGTGAPGRKTRVLGDIVVSMPTVARQAAEHSVSLEQELALMVVHATLHLLGYDHAEPSDRDRMWRRQDELVTRIMNQRGQAIMKASASASEPPRAES